MAIITYYFLGVGFFEYERKMIAIILLFSAGTFLYVATAHVLPEIQHMKKGAATTTVDGMAVQEEGLVAVDDRRGVRGRTGATAAASPTEGARGSPETKAAANEGHALSWMDVAFLVTGIIAPLFITVEHSHE